MSFDFDNPSVDLQIDQNVPGATISRAILTLGNQWVRACVERGGATQAWYFRVNGEKTLDWIAGWPKDSLPALFSNRIFKDVIQTKKEFIIQNHQNSEGGGVFPVLGGDHVIGLLALTSDQMDYFSASTIAWIQAFSVALSYSISQVEKQIEKIRAKNSIARIVQSNLSLQEILQAIFRILSDITRSDATVVLKYNAASQKFEFLAKNGLDADVFTKVHRFIENDLAKKIIGKRHLAQIEDAFSIGLDENQTGLFAQDGFCTHKTIPLIGHRNFLGVLEIFWHETQHADAWTREIVQMAGESIAFAMEHASILGDLERRNEELTAIYTATIEGLSRALELRDLETEGHTRRVSALTVQLAEHMQIPADQRASIQQGALLHDIGKLGIPDAILLKPGSLTAKEWKVMQQHPLFAYNILVPITSLRHALDIPLYHHEHWDGSGYPYGLKDEQIPLSARVFAVVDVYDALTSDRPYRSAWPRFQAIDYLREQAGIQFDPQVVMHFLSLLEGK